MKADQSPSGATSCDPLHFLLGPRYTAGSTCDDVAGTATTGGTVVHDSEIHTAGSASVSPPKLTEPVICNAVEDGLACSARAEADTSEGVFPCPGRASGSPARCLGHGVAGAARRPPLREINSLRLLLWRGPLGARGGGE